MEQARNYVCHQCSTPVPVGHKFCGRCGAPIPEHVLNLRTEFFGPIQAAGSARLTLIRGENVIEGLTYSLSNSEHFAGRVDGNILFPNDAWMSPRHASFFYSDGKLFVRDENSVNGIFVRIKQPVHLQPGDQFLCGEEVFELAATPKDDSGPDEDQTYFYASPKRPSPFRVVQILRGGAPGMVYCARENSIQIGRDESDMNFPDDVYMSANHAKVELSSDGKFLLIDNGSKNGTYIRVAQQAELHHGDYVFLGKQLLRVEIAA
jgi:pSer/pThr/pTyr-binding forkhead associated (FHA) protein